MSLPRTMRVARFHGWGDVRVESAPVPQPGRGEIVVRIAACGLCGSDALRWYVERKAPVVLGHEPAGTVAAVGSAVSTLHPGDRVFVHHHAACGECAECRRGLWSNCMTWRRQALQPGGFAEFALASADTVARDTLALPATLDFETATFIEPVACCIRAVRRQGGLREGDDLCIIGLGAMGLLMVQLSRIFGARRSFGLDFIPERRQRARSLGAQLALDPASEQDMQALREATGGRGADVVIVCPGDPRTVQAGIRMAAPGARVVCFTPQAPELPLTVDQSALYFREIAIMQSYSSGPDETRAALRLLAESRLDVASLITHRAGLDGVGEALERISAKAGIKTIVLPWS